jgi:hypothetical protein
VDGTYSATKYPDGRYATFEDGKAYEEFVASKIKYLFGITLHFYKGKTEQLKGENAEGVEIKFDARMKDTDNIYIETAEKSKGNNLNYYPSGIFREDNSCWFWIGDYKQAFVFEKKTLQKAILDSDLKKVETLTSQGILINIEQAKIICKRHFIF